ncbi:MAG: YhfC family intramembrane metalloprotease [Firmicutes bacterium]|nr:YhfC family intramembrane metalloprotease [Bacillota bacterium]
MKKIHPIFYLTGTGMIAVAVFSMIYAVINDISMGMFLLGGISWIISVSLKVMWATSMNKQVLKMLKDKLGSTISKVLSWSYIGILTGIFECGFVLAFVYFLPTLNQAELKNILGYGIGFGAFEALSLGTGNVTYLVKHKNIEDDTGNRFSLNMNNILLIPLGIVERIFTLFIHVFSCVLIFIAVQENLYLYFWVSFVFKSFVDAIAAWLILEKDIRNISKASQHWVYQSIFIILGLIALIGTINVYPS